jgi:hypothetical protein
MDVYNLRMTRAAAAVASPAAAVGARAPGPGDGLPTEAGACALCGAREGVRVASGPDFEYDTTRTELSLWRCACGGVYLDPRPAPEALARIYPSNYYAYDFVEKVGRFVMRFKSMAERTKVRAYRAYVPDGGRVLDIGCGDGHVLGQLRRHGGASLRLEGVEFSPVAIAAAERAGFVVHRGRIEEVELPPGAFDLVIMNQLIEHVADPVAVLRKVAAALRPGGVVSSRPRTSTRPTRVSSGDVTGAAITCRGTSISSIGAPCPRSRAAPAWFPCRSCPSSAPSSGSSRSTTGSPIAVRAGWRRGSSTR